MRRFRTVGRIDVVIRAGAEEAEMTVVGHAADTTVGELLGGDGDRPPPAIVFVDGRPVPGTFVLDRAGVGDGSVLDTRPPPTIDSPGDAGGGACIAVGPAVELVVLGGPGTGSGHHLVPGVHRVGPGSRMDGRQLAAGPVAAPALELDVAADGAVIIRPGEARLDGRTVDPTAAWAAGDIVTVDGRALGLRPVRHNVATASPMPPGLDGGRLPLHRPPRSPTDEDPAPLTIPEAARIHDTVRRFPLVAMLAPLPVAAGVAVLLDEWRFLLFGLLSPVMLVGSWLDERRTRRADRRRATRSDAAALADLKVDAAQRFADDVARSRRSQPTMPDVVDRARRGDVALWERRPHHADAYRLAIAIGTQPWRPALEWPSRPLDGAETVLAACGPMDSVPIEFDLRASAAFGLAGDTVAASAAARGIVLTATALHGPADLDLVVCTNATRLAAWEWTKWLPHARVDDRPALVTTADDVRAWSATLDGPFGEAAVAREASAATAPLTLVVADGDEWWRGRDAPLRAILRSPGVRLLAIAAHASALPASCSTIMTLQPNGGARLDGETVSAPLVDVDLARSTARALARFDDPERPLRRHDALPHRSSLLDLLDPFEPTPAEVRRRWHAERDPRRLATPIGVGEHGTVVLDLVADGPHGLVAGTTGAGKSELLRTIVLGLATTTSPDDLNFALVDFKGGAAFDTCAELAHTVAMVTDLDEHMAGRVLRSLQAEVTYRERVLRGAAVGTIEEYRRRRDPAPGGPLPRLLLVVDEFALLAAELPTFVPALVDIAQRGRSLGVHLLLATQRPAGVVDAKIRANTNLRIALRVQDDADSLDVIGTSAAARLPRRIPGRAIARLGAGELVELQTAWSAGSRRRRHTSENTLEARPFVAGRRPSAFERRCSRAARPVADEASGADEVPRMVDAVNEAAASLGQDRQRRPYLDPLPTSLSLHELLELDRDGSDGGVPFALADLPDEQRQELRHWQPGASLAVYGIAGAGTSSTLAVLAIGLAERAAPDAAHLYVIDADANLLRPLDLLPHCGAVAGLDDPSRVDRLLRHLVGELARRRRLAAELGSPARVLAVEPTITLLVDNVGALRQALEADRTLAESWPAFERIVRDGRTLGIGVVVTAAHDRALPAALAAAIPDRLVMRAADRQAYAAFGLRAVDLPTMRPGRAIDPSGPFELQIAAPPRDLAAAVGRITTAAGTARRRTGEVARRRPVARVEALPDHVAVGALLAMATDDGTSMVVPVGLDRRDGRPVGLRLRRGSTVLVLGPSGSGRTTLLHSIAIGARSADPAVVVFAVAARRAAFADDRGLRCPADPRDVANWVDELLGMGGHRLVLVDDADELGGPSFERLASARNGELTFVLAGAPDGMRGVAHWTRPLLRTRTGILLRPSSADGELLRVPLPAQLPSAPPGHGILVDHGDLVPLLVARPDAVRRS